ncbi:MAG: hypothetical protein LBQ79_03030, partial [Deltaproteobacteria bacterium]|nr:hypothetical protein [Deltaproteobacteria bacterium]
MDSPARALPASSSGGFEAGRAVRSGLLGSVGLCVASVLVALTLCGSENFAFGRRNSFTTDQFNNLALTASVSESLRSGVLLPRVSPPLSGGLGNPYHQFYSPLVHTVSALVSMAVGDVVAGYSVTVILLLAFAFASMYRLGLYLTGSKACAIFGALVFVTAPYVHADRTLRGAYPEYFGFCLLPAVTYLNLRSLSLRSYRRWALAVIATAALMLSHLVTAFYFLFFSAVFILFSGISSFLQGPGRGIRVRGGNPSSDLHAAVGNPPRGRCPFMRKVLAASSVAFAALLLSMWYMGPAVLYKDLIMKTDIMERRARTVESGAMTPPLVLLSQREQSWNWDRQSWDFSRLQIGLLVCASLTAFAGFRLGRGGVYTVPLVAVSALIFVFIAFPEVFGLPLLKRLDIAQFSYRFLAHLALAGAIAGAVALRDFFGTVRGFDPALRSIAVLALAAVSLAFVAPYLYPLSAPHFTVRNIAWPKIGARGSLDYGENVYMRTPPPEEGPAWTETGIKGLAAADGRPGDVLFRTDLQRYRSESRVPGDDVLLEVLYFPGLQDVDVRVDGLQADLELGTWWQRRSEMHGYLLKDPGAFHGLRLSGAPSAGTLEVRARFTGYRWANAVSLAS